jgi:hypothetical protein
LAYGSAFIKKKSPVLGTGLPSIRQVDLQVLDDVGEDVADGRAKQDQDDDHDNGNQNQDESVLNEALTLFTRLIQHDTFSLYEDKIDTIVS